jgi:hypothetical protein
MDPWASRETSAPFDFFKCLAVRVATTFFTGALGAFGDFTTGSTSCKEGSSAAISPPKEQWQHPSSGRHCHCKESKTFHQTRKEESKYKK